MEKGRPEEVKNCGAESSSTKKKKFGLESMEGKKGGGEGLGKKKLTLQKKIYFFPFLSGTGGALSTASLSFIPRR